jgi:spermidine synthase
MRDQPVNWLVTAQSYTPYHRECTHDGSPERQRNHGCDHGDVAVSRPRGRRGSLIVHAEDGIVVRRDPDRATGRMVLLDGMEASYVDIADPAHLEFTYLRRIRDAIDATWPMRAELDVVHIGGAGCALARHLAATRPNTRNEVWEYDQRVADIARRYLGVQSGPRLRLRVGDARPGIERRPAASADVVVGDAFVDGLVPAHLSTVEFGAALVRILRPGGFYALNVIDAPPLRISRRIGATLLAVFPEVALVGTRRMLNAKTIGNLVFVASQEPLELDVVRVRAARDGEPSDVLGRGEVEYFAAGAKPLRDAGSGLAYEPSPL